MQPITIQFAVRVGYVMISRENNIMQIDLPDCSTLPLAHMFIWAMFGVLGADSLHCF